ncbi:ATP-binding protein [Amycolatopsis nigrescens]|uniref:ATP-binding protein n=1 Tax=Amycolatopsis nigrescens TaxID=381445 RepID=UPI000399C4C4|nr:ATP-binding protein [Amycolatopsis nigrescens]
MDDVLRAEAATTLPAELGSDAEARRFVAGALTAWGCTGPIEDAMQVTSELVANVLRHTTGRPRLTVRTVHDERSAGSSVSSLPFLGYRIRIEVADSSSRLPVRRTGGQQGGWGLQLVERLAVEWGVRRLARGKVVWCELEAGPAAS